MVTFEIFVHLGDHFSLLTFGLDVCHVSFIQVFALLIDEITLLCRCQLETFLDLTDHVLLLSHIVVLVLFLILSVG